MFTRGAHLQALRDAILKEVSKACRTADPVNKNHGATGGRFQRLQGFLARNTSDKHGEVIIP